MALPCLAAPRRMLRRAWLINTTTEIMYRLIYIVCIVDDHGGTEHGAQHKDCQGRVERNGRFASLERDRTSTLLL